MYNYDFMKLSGYATGGGVPILHFLLCIFLFISQLNFVRFLAKLRKRAKMIAKTLKKNWTFSLRGYKYRISSHQCGYIKPPHSFNGKIIQSYWTSNKIFKKIRRKHIKQTGW
jgi:hypothetical protein